MDTNESQVEQSGCGCDSSSGDEHGSAPGGKKNFRTILFVTVLLLAGAVAAHSVLTNGDKGGCLIRGLCSVDKGNGDGQACSTKAACPLEQGNGNGDGQACAIDKGNGDGQACAEIAACPLEQGNGNGGGECCPSETQVCPKTGAPGKAAGCCPAMAPADPAPQPAPTGCCPSMAPADPAPQPAPTGCCPTSGS